MLCVYVRSGCGVCQLSEKCPIRRPQHELVRPATPARDPRTAKTGAAALSFAAGAVILLVATLVAGIASALG